MDQIYCLKGKLCMEDWATTLDGLQDAPPLLAMMICPIRDSLLLHSVEPTYSNSSILVNLESSLVEIYARRYMNRTLTCGDLCSCPSTPAGSPGINRIGSSPVVEGDTQQHRDRLKGTASARDVLQPYTGGSSQIRKFEQSFQPSRMAPNSPMQKRV
jgi:hypothetical protein